MGVSGRRVYCCGASPIPGSCIWPARRAWIAPRLRRRRAAFLETADIVIIGGGIAGLSAAHALTRAGAGRVRLLEKESVLCSHSSGRNAAIFLHLSSSPDDVDLARRSRSLLNELHGSEGAWLQKTGAWLVSEKPAALEPLSALAIRERLAFEPVKGTALESALPSLQGGAMRRGLFFPEEGVIDIHAVTQQLARASTAAGATVSLGAEVARIDAASGKVTGVTLASGERIAAGVVVNAAGAWGEPLGASAEAALPLRPLRRHLALLEIKPSGAEESVVWCVDEDAYYRPDSGGMLASPCDEEPWTAELPETSQAGLELLAKKLARVAPRLAQASVRRSWACLRTFAPDRNPVIGPDPRAAGLFWLAGLGGHGMTAGVAAGELLATTVVGKLHRLAKALAPSRLASQGNPPRHPERSEA